MTRAGVALAVGTIIVTALQLAVFSPLRIGGVVVMIVWLWPLAVALVAQTSVAVVTAVVTGVLFDVHAITPFGASAVVGVVLALAIGALAKEGVGDLDGSAWWVAPALAAPAGFIAPVVFVVASAIDGHAAIWHASLLASMTANMIAFVVLVRPLARVAQRLVNQSDWARA